VDTYWAIHTTDGGAITGLASRKEGTPLVVETYPCYVLKRFWPQFRIPSKRKIQTSTQSRSGHCSRRRGYGAATAPGRPDHVDAMLWALAAQACLQSDGLPAGTVGAEPYIDEDERVIREGYSVAP
jgi:hypothetical protein